ncbi:histone-lysine N-methyltransferase SETMAR-like [Sitodiplosis mosellana]|uniref:histone-lysine N-methyltransferase SETMAR-like n=1 Tax=Sitodiplosis mosellana TaxID=263140 RepID=UPI0024447338|nr:histone-lysine N-methyltransferase SETMAR-like [Sitodiplosis mosellana]
MELNREHFRAIIFHNFRRGLSRQECIDELISLYGEQAPSFSTVKNWYNEFNRGRHSLQDEHREGRPKSAVVPENIDAVRELIMLDRHVTYREIEASLGISMKSIGRILHDHLAVKKICSRWIPHNLTNAQKKARVDWSKEMLKKYNRGGSNAVYNIYTVDESWIYAYEPETKQQSTVWVFQDEPNPTKVVRGRSTSKQMIACFFGINGHVATVPLQERRTVNSEWYTTICLPTVFGEIRKTQKRRRIILHHDNASSHKSAETMGYLSTQNVELMGHPAYSPDLAPNDFFLFPHIKNKMRGQRFPTPEDAVDAFKTHVLELPQSEWKKCFENWFKRMQKCIDLHGEYFEKQ